MHNSRLLRLPSDLSQPLRRVLVAASLIGYGTGIVVQDLVRRSESGMWAAGLVLLLLGVGATLLVWRWSRNRARWEDDGLDERDRRERDRSWAVSYRILTLAVIFGPGTVLFLSLAQADVAAGVLTNLLFALLPYVLILPTLVLAWMEPDLPAEDA